MSRLAAFTLALPSREDRLPLMVLASLGIHGLLLLIVLAAWHTPLVLVPRVLTVQFANVNDVKINDYLGDKRKQRPTSGLQKVKNLLEETRNIVPILNQDHQPDNAGPSVARPELSREDIAKANKEKLERLLSETADETRPAAGSRKKGNESLLNEADAQRAKNASSGTPMTGDQAPSTASADAGVNASLVMNSAGRKVVYEPPAPASPEWAKRDKVQGRVVLKVWFDKDGFPTGTEVVQSSGNSLLDSTAKNHALKFRIAPISEDREDLGVFTINFVL